MIMMTVHVDDMLVATDGSREAEDCVDQLLKKYSITDVKAVSKLDGGVEYTGQTIEVKPGPHGDEAHVHQKKFIQGRFEQISISKQRRGEAESSCTPLETSEFRSAVGSMHWTTSLTRPDGAFDTNQLQKRQAKAIVGDLKNANKAITAIKNTPNEVLRIRPLSNNMAVVVWTDSALYNSEGEWLGEDPDLAGYDRHSVYSQAGALIGLMNADGLDKDGNLPLPILDWRSRATKRVVMSTFSAEAAAATEGFGMGVYMRALICEVYHGCRDPTDWDGSVIGVKLVVDCKSLYDNMAKDASVPEDKWTAIYIGALRCGVSAGVGRSQDKADMLWLPSRHQLADGLTTKGLGDNVRQIMRSGVTRLHELSEQELKRRRDEARLANS